MRERYEEYQRQAEIVIVESEKVENAPPQELATEIVAPEIPQKAVLSEEKSEPILVEATVEEELVKIGNVGNGKQQLLALSVLVELLRETKQKPKGKKQQKCNRLITDTNIVLTLGNRKPKGFSKALELVNSE